MGVCGRALRVTAGASRTALRLLGVGPLRLRSRACPSRATVPGTLRLPLTPRLGVDGALGGRARTVRGSASTRPLGFPTVSHRRLRRWRSHRCQPIPPQSLRSRACRVCGRVVTNTAKLRQWNFPRNSSILANTCSGVGLGNRSKNLRHSSLSFRHDRQKPSG